MSAADPGERELPMFPLGTVLFPFAVLPLHVFEARYRALVEHCLAGEPEFGVVLIERGHEVGGGDERFATGTVARIAEVARITDGRIVLATVGTRRIEVTRWLPEDPFPRALVVDRPDAAPTDDLSEQVAAVRRAAQRTLGLLAEHGAPVGSLSLELDPDPVTASYQLASSAPLGALDAQRVLEAGSVAARLAMLDAVLTDAATVLEARFRS